jgi:hypothetical protein
MSISASAIKGALLEYLVRNLLKSCGFTNVKVDPSGIYSYESQGLFFINGKGAAHDADVIMNPPVQMPFGYPSQLIFECKAYDKNISLAIVRNAAGLRYDLNEFEIVTKDSLKARKNNRRASYAIEMRLRYNYQVGVASINNFTKPSIEFAANNKIPLLSLSWFLDRNTIMKISKIDNRHLELFGLENAKKIYDFFKDREGSKYQDKYEDVRNLLNNPNLFSEIINEAEVKIHNSYVALLETGDVVFLFHKSGDDILRYYNSNFINYNNVRFNWYEEEPDLWILSIINSEGFENKYEFYLPIKIFSFWNDFRLDKLKALELKQDFFSKMFVFSKSNNEFPFITINIDKKWLVNAMTKLKLINLNNLDKQVDDLNS